MRLRLRRGSGLALVFALAFGAVGSVGSAAEASEPTPVRQVAAGLAAHQATIKLSLPNVGQATKIIADAVKADDYVGMIVKSYTVRTSRAVGKTSGTATYEVVYLETKAQSDYVTAQARKIVAKLVKPGMSDFQKEKLLHDYIATYVSYDDSLRKYTAYEALKTGEAVCQGYALLTYRLMDEAGIPVRIVSGSVSTGLHAWNKVKLGGQWYNVDTTWDSQNGLDYSYFNVSDAELKRDHKWTQGDLPAATADYRTTLKALAKKGGANAPAFQTILKDIGERFRTTDEAIAYIAAAAKAKKTSAKFQYVYGSRNLKKDVQAMGGVPKGAKSISISYRYGNGLATVEAKLGY